MKKLSKVFDDAIERSRRRTTIYATMGKRLADGSYLFIVDGEPESVWVTMRLSSGAQTTIPAVNSAGLPHSPKLAVEMRREGEKYVIIRRSSEKAISGPQPTDPSGVQPHLHSHLGLSDTDLDVHPQYHNDARGDVRYYTKVEIADETDPFADDDRVLAEADGLSSLVWSSWANIKTRLTTLFNGLYVALTGDQNVEGTKSFVDGVIEVGDGTGNVNVKLIAPAGSPRDLTFYSDTDDAADRRWFFRVSGAETGSDAGGDWVINAFDDAGSVFPSAMFFRRSDRYIGFGTGVPIAKMHLLHLISTDPVMRLEVDTTGANIFSQTYMAKVSTTNATVTTLFTFAIPTDQCQFIKLRVHARRTGGASGTGTSGQGAWFRLEAGYNNIGGTVTLIGATPEKSSNVMAAGASAAWDANLTISGTDVLLEVTGAASMNVAWGMVADVSRIST